MRVNINVFFTKLGMCIGTVEIRFGITKGITIMVGYYRFMFFLYISVPFHGSQPLLLRDGAILV